MWVRESIVTLSPDVRKTIMLENTTLVSKGGHLRAMKQHLLSTITKPQDEALLVTEKTIIVEARLETLVKESQGLFLNGPTPLETTHEVI